MAALVSPLVLGTLLVVLGLLLWRTRSFESGGRILVGATLGLLYVLGLTPLADALIRPFERPWSAMETTEYGNSVGYVVMLASGARFDPRMPPGAQLADESLYRLVEALRIHRELGGTELFLMAGARGGARGEPSPYAATAQALGVDDDRMRILFDATDTAGEARVVREAIGHGRGLVLVTSAAHLPRALLHFRAEGLDPIPAPAHYWARSSPLGWRSFFPSAEGFRKSERAVHEGIGLLWAWLRHRSTGAAG